MNILPALQHHLNQTTPHKWHSQPIRFGTTTVCQIRTHTKTLYIQITQNDNTLTIVKETTHHNENRLFGTTIDLLDPEFLTKIHQIIT